MTLNGFLSLAAQTVTAPREVARLLLSLRLSSEALLTAFALVVVLNALVFSVTLLVVPSQGDLGLLGDPVVFMAMQAATLGGVIAALYWVGSNLGGQATMGSIAILLIWLQALRVLVQSAFIFVLPLSDMLSGAIMLGASAIGVWIMLNFVDEAHGFSSLGKSAIVLILSLLAMAVGLSMLLALIGVTPNGMNANV